MDEPEAPAIVTVTPIVTEDQVVVGRYDERSERRAATIFDPYWVRELAELFDEARTFRPNTHRATVNDEPAFPNLDRLSRGAGDPFDQDDTALRGSQYDDLTRARSVLIDEIDLGEGDTDSEGELVDKYPVALLDGREHGARGDHVVVGERRAGCEDHDRRCENGNPCRTFLSTRAFLAFHGHTSESTMSW